MKIVAFAGRKQSGKTTCSYYIENLILRDFQTSHSCKIYNFADPLKKDICMNILGLSYELLLRYVIIMVEFLYLLKMYVYIHFVHRC